ncbi:alanine racemase [Cetobacterium sp. 8H]|uniref:alanine racemase n=1 Tax=Cetobacterium sp. 8H TaxID=2759681 RepID=UPI00163C6674|nr:alanine racemase [Cetobacterium sp. 8H]
MGRNGFQININKDNIIHNFNYIKNSTKKDVITVVKANAYGHGLIEVIPILIEAGCSYFAVARESEAKEILNLNIPNIKILVFETLENLSILDEHKNLEMIINSLEELKEAIDLKLNFSQLHLKLDFGFARNGVYYEQFEEVKNLILQNDLYFKGAMTHFFASTPDEMLQIQKQFMETIKFLGIDRFKVIHSQNSAATLLKIGDGSTHVRCGISVLGMVDIGLTDNNIKRSWSLVGSVYNIKNFDHLNFIGYERISDLNTNGFKKVAKIKLGYGDGFSKKNTNILCHINQKTYQIVHISMDTSFILVDDSVNEGDLVEIYKDFEECNNYLNMAHYEYTTLLNKRIPRIITKNTLK